MKNKSVEIVSTALALGVVLSAVIGVSVHKRSRKDTSCWLARAECVQSFNDESEKNVFAGTEATKQPLKKRVRNACRLPVCARL